MTLITSFTKPAILSHKPALDTYITKVSQEVMLSKSQKTFRNLRNEEWRALKELRNQKDTTIKPADKGGAVVVLNTTDYVSECNR